MENAEITNNESKKNIPQKNMHPLETSTEEQVKYYKELFMKSKKLILHYEENIKNKEEIVKNLKQKLKDYEAGNMINFIL